MSLFTLHNKLYIYIYTYILGKSRLVKWEATFFCAKLGSSKSILFWEKRACESQACASKLWERRKLGLEGNPLKCSSMWALVVHGQSIHPIVGSWQPRTLPIPIKKLQSIWTLSGENRSRQSCTRSSTRSIGFILPADCQREALACVFWGGHHWRGEGSNCHEDVELSTLYAHRDKALSWLWLHCI